jgi:hypothetical protein
MDLFAMNLDDFGFFPVFSRVAGKMPSAWGGPRQGAAEGLRADWITRFRGRDEKAGITYADFGNGIALVHPSIASGRSESPGGPCTHSKAPPFHGTLPDIALPAVWVLLDLSV